MFFVHFPDLTLESTDRYSWNLIWTLRIGNRRQYQNFYLPTINDNSTLMLHWNGSEMLYGNNYSKAIGIFPTWGSHKCDHLLKLKAECADSSRSSFQSTSLRLWKRAQFVYASCDALLGLLFSPEDEGSTVLASVHVFLSSNTARHSRRQNSSWNLH
jgi:hypothetical protein